MLLGIVTKMKLCYPLSYKVVLVKLTGGQLGAQDAARALGFKSPLARALGPVLPPGGWSNYWPKDLALQFL
jgi:hypothetical protein